MKFVVKMLWLILLMLGCCSATSTVTRKFSARAVDLTLQAGASGEAVVDACILKINNLQVFPNDFGLLKRIALVETDFGTNSASSGGIWQITPAIHTALLQYQFPTLLLTAIDFAFGASIADLTSSDFSVPLRSAVAARLYILTQTTVIPGSITDQAQWWSSSYNPNGVASDFEAAVTAYEATSGCTIDKMDLWFLLDGSGSVSSTDYRTSLEFIDELSQHFNIAPDAIRAGFSVYSTYHYFISKFDANTTNAEFSQAVLGAFKPNQGTYTGWAIRDVVDNGFNVSVGARPLSSGAPRVLVVLTDGRSGDDVLQPSEYARNSSVTVFGVGIGSGVNEDEINEIANDPDSTYAFPLADFSQLHDVLKQSLEQQTCQISVEIQDNTTVSATVQPGDTHFSNAQFPYNGSVELTFEVTSVTSVGVVYFSANFVNPSPALNHFSVEITFGITVIVINADDLYGISLVQTSNVRNRRAISDQPKSLYFGVASTGSAPLDINFKSVGSNMKRSGNRASPGMKMCLSLFFMSVVASVSSLAL